MVLPIGRAPCARPPLRAPPDARERTHGGAFGVRGTTVRQFVVDGLPPLAAIWKPSRRSTPSHAGSRDWLQRLPPARLQSKLNNNRNPLFGLARAQQGVRLATQPFPRSARLYSPLFVFIPFPSPSCSWIAAASASETPHSFPCEAHAVYPRACCFTGPHYSDFYPLILSCTRCWFVGTMTLLTYSRL